MHEELLKSTLKFDPLATAETIAGERVDDGGHAFALGFVLANQHAKLKQDLLRHRGDVYEGISVVDFTSIVEAAGFEKVLEIPFVKESHGDRRDEVFIVFAHRDGLLLRVDSYNGVRINDGAVYYNWRPHKEAGWHEFVHSGGMRSDDNENWIWCGDHGAREALIFNLDQLRANGEFVTPWIKQPFLWLLHYGDTVDGYDHVAITRSRLAQLPDWVREFVGEY
jgi:hypothetical protein